MSRKTNGYCEKLSVPDRVVLLDILPPMGDITTVRIVRDLREELSFSEAEHVKFGIKIEGGRVSWKSSAPKDVEIGPKAREVIVNSFKWLDGQKKLTEQHLEMYDRFVGKEE